MKREHGLFLAAIFTLGVFLRLYPRVSIDPHLLTFQGDIWYRLAMAQHILDFQTLPNPDLRYISYGNVPMWYPPLSPLFLAGLSRLTGLDLPTITSRLMPFIEAVAPLSIFPLAMKLKDEMSAYVATLALALTPTFVFWTGISDTQTYTLFFIPLYILFLIRQSESRDPKNIGILGVALALNFLIHLSYFLAVLILISTAAALVIGKRAGPWLIRDVGLSIALSQLLTLPWWLPNNLYWWWIKALVTSSGMYSAIWQMGDYGVIAASLGITSFLYIAARGRDWRPLLILWALPIFLESQNEAILFALNRVDLTWSTIAKPLEGFRFFPYLAQPASIAIGITISDLIDRSKRVRERTQLDVGVLLLLGGVMLYGIMGPYNLGVKLQTSGLTTEEYQAAVWFRENTGPEHRIAADYYRAQMFSGVTGGRALDGGMFPLRNVDLPYISVPAVVQDDLYTLYTTESPTLARDIARKYNLTHIFYSANMEAYGNLLSNNRPASQYGVPVTLDKFEDSSYFKRAYQNQDDTVRIYEVQPEGD